MAAVRRPGELLNRKLLSGLLWALLGTNGVDMPIASADIISKTLPNGFRVVVIPDHEQPAVFLRVLLPRGQNDAPPGRTGLADLTAELTLKGAGSRDAAEMAELADHMGAELIADADAEYTVMGCNCLADQLDTALTILHDVVFEPRFDPREFSLLKDQTLAEIKARKSNPSYLAAIRLSPAVYGPDSPQGKVKTEETVNAIRMEDVRAFHQTLLQAQGAIALCIGDVQPDSAAERLGQMFGSVKPGSPPSIPFGIPSSRAADQVIEVEKEDLTQTTVLIGKPGPGRLETDFYSTLVSNYVLGAGGFVSRLMAAVRSRGGKTYGIRSGIAMTATSDLFDVKFTTRNEELIPSLQITLDVLNRYAAEGPTDQEVAEAKEFYKGYFFLQTETPGQRAAKLLVYLFYGLGFDEYHRYPDRVDAVTRAGAHESARRHFSSDNLTFCLVGPKAVTRGAKEWLAKSRIKNGR